MLEGLYWQGIIYSCLLLGVSIVQPVLLVNRFTVSSGKISYSVYLNHPTLIVLSGFVFTYVNEFRLPTTFQFGICFLFTAVPLHCISVITHKFIENPGMELGKKIIDLIKSKEILTT